MAEVQTNSILIALLIVAKHGSDVCCNEFPAVPQIDHKSK